MKYWKLTVLAMTAITASSPAQNAGNHNPAFSVPNTFIGGEPYIFIGENDGEVFEPRTPVGLQLRNPPGQDEPYNGSTTLQWSSSSSGVLAFDGELSMTGFKDEDRTGDGDTGEAGDPWTWTDGNQANFHNDTIFLQGSASAEPGTVTLESFHSEDPNDKFTKDFTLLKVDLDIDSDNTNGADTPDRSSAEEALEDDDDEPGKLIGVNNGDRDFDNIPDYADGFDGEILSDVNFTPLVLEMPDGIDIDKLKIKLIYNASDPSQLSITPEYPVTAEDKQNNKGGNSSWTTRDGEIYTLPSGNMRIWLKDANEARNSSSILSEEVEGDFIPTNIEIPFEKLNGDTTERTVTLYVEGIKPSSFPGDDPIQFELGIDNGSTVNYLEVDEVRTTVTDVAFKTASGDGFLERDEYTFGSADFSFSESYNYPDAASLVVYSIKSGESMDMDTLTLPAAPQMMNEVVDYYIGERTEDSLPLAATEVSPESSSEVNQVVSVDSNSSDVSGFTYLDAEGGARSANNVALGSAAVVVFTEKEIQRVGVRRVNQKYNDSSLTDIDAPPFSASDAQALEDFLNNQVFKSANIPWRVTLLDDLDIDYDSDENGRLSPSEDSVIRSNGNDSNSDYMLYLVDWIDLPGFTGPGGGYSYVPSTYAVVSGRASVSNETIAHELGHAQGLEHPFEYGIKFPPLADDYDPQNLMNYTSGIKLRLPQWLVLNQLPSE